MKKIIFIAFLMILCVGCQANYNLTINEDLTVEESLRAMEDEEFFKQYEKSSIGRVVGFILEPYLDTLNSNSYTTNTYVTDTEGGVTLNKKYKNLQEYKDNTLITNQFTDNVIYSKDGNLITIKANGAFSKAEQNQQKIPVDEATISMEVPFKVTEHNADIVNGNVYTWNFAANDSEAREVKIVFDSSKVVNSNKFALIILIVVIIVLLVATFMLYNMIRNRRESVNKI